MTEPTDIRIAGPLVDAHAHVFDGRVPLSDMAWHAPAGDGTTEDLLASFDRAGVHFGVLAAASIFGDYNDYMRNATRQNKRLRTTVIVPPNVELETLKAMDADGVVGIRLQFRSTTDLPDLSSFEYRKLFRRLADLNWHVHLHDQGERLHRSIPHIENAGVRLVIDHFGRPDLSLGVNAPGFRAVLAAIARGQTWIKLSAAFRLTPLEKLREFSDVLIANAGPERLLWGSDWPFVAYEQGQTYAGTIQDYYSLVPDPSFRHAIDRTALRFYFA